LNLPLQYFRIGDDNGPKTHSSNWSGSHFSELPARARAKCGAGNGEGAQANKRLGALGYEVQTCLVSPDTTSEVAVRDALAQAAFDCIMIGAGLGGLVENIILFERVMNVIHQDAPLAKLCFNTQPSDTVEAVLRWV
jgi:hypothetical protein